MMPLRFDNLRTVLCLGCHPDDIEIGCGGTILKLLEQQPGVTVWWAVFSGAGVRADEARRGADLFLRGAAERNIVVRDFRDRYFPQQYEQVKDFLHSLSQEVRPDVIFTHRLEDVHQDHRLLAELTWNAFRDHLVLEYEIPKYEGDLGRPNVFVPLSEPVCRQKIAALHEAFVSQREKPWFDEATFWALLRLRGLECNSATRFAEGLYCRKLAL